MSLVLGAMRSQRIIALPMYKRLKFHPDSLMLSKPVVDQMTIYYHFNLTSPDELAKNKQSGMLNRLTTKAADTWAGFGKAPKGSWKLRLYEYGERLVDRMDFEELALKGVDPSLAPPLRNPGTTGKQLTSVSQSDDKVQQRHQEIPLIYPPSAYSELFVPTLNPTLHPSLSQLRSLLSIRKPRHRRGFYLWMLIAPLTFPFIIIPIIPNIPFFFCAWRSWSHYRAYRSSQYLSSLIDQGLVRPEPSQELDEVYRSLFPSASSIRDGPSISVPTSSLEDPESTGDPHLDPPSSTTTGTACDNDGDVVRQVLLTREVVPRILELFDLPESTAGDIYRAVQQVNTRVAQEFTNFRPGK